MNRETYIKRLNYSKRGYFYDLYIEGEEGSERERFLQAYAAHKDLWCIEDIMEAIEAPTDTADIITQSFFRREHKQDHSLIATPGKSDNDGIIWGSDTDLRLFCYMPTPHTLIYLNGYAHDGKDGEWQDHPVFGTIGNNLYAIMRRMMRAKSIGFFDFDPNSGKCCDNNQELTVFSIPEDI